MKWSPKFLCLLVVGLSIVSASSASAVLVRVSVESLVPQNSVAFAALRIGFGNGTFDSFNEGEAGLLLGQADIADAPIVTVAEGGLGKNRFPAFAAAEPNAVLGTVAAAPFLPGATAFADFTVDSNVNPYFTFAAMVVPSNDFSIGNDSPTEYMLFNPDGSLAINDISLTAADIWNAGSETENPLNAAFVQIGSNDPRENQNGVVTRDFDLATTFNGLITGAGYAFNSQLTANTPIYRISFSTVPEPASLSMCGLGGFGLLMRRSRRTAIR